MSQWRPAHVFDALAALRPFAVLESAGHGLWSFLDDGVLERWSADGVRLAVGTHPSTRPTHLEETATAALALHVTPDGIVEVLTADFAVWRGDGVAWSRVTPPEPLARASDTWRSTQWAAIRRPVSCSGGGAFHVTALCGPDEVPTRESWRFADGTWARTSTEAPPMFGGTFCWDADTCGPVWIGGRRVSGSGTSSDNHRVYELRHDGWRDAGKASPAVGPFWGWSTTDPASGRMLIQWDGVASYAGQGRFVGGGETQGFEGNLDKGWAGLVRPDGTLVLVKTAAEGGSVALGPEHLTPLSDAELAAKRAGKAKAARAKRAPVVAPTPVGSLPLSETWPDRLEALSVLEQLWARKVLAKPKIGRWLRTLDAAAVATLALPEDHASFTEGELAQWFEETHGYEPHPLLEAHLLATPLLPAQLEGVRPRPLGQVMIGFLAPFWDGEDDGFGSVVDL